MKHKCEGCYDDCEGDCCPLNVVQKELTRIQIEKQKRIESLRGGK
jgi:hypothetical protein